jgi:hypothetical protein
MRRFAQEDLSKIRELTQNGASLREISSLLKRSKSSVQYHYAKIEGKKPRQKDLLIGNLSTPELGWLFGFYTGDGSRNLRKKTYSYEVKFALNIREYAIVEYVEKLLLECGVRSWRYIDQKRVYVKCLNKNLYEFVEKYLKWEGTKKSRSVRLASPSSHGDDFLFGFLCGIIDADGGTKRLYISTSSEKLADNIREISAKLNIASKTYRYDVFHIYLRKSDYLNVCKKFGFSSIKHRS